MIHFTHPRYTHAYLTRRKQAAVDNVFRILRLDVIGAVQWRSRKSHQTCKLVSMNVQNVLYGMLTCPRRLEDSKGRNELHEGVNPGRLRRDLNDAVVRADIEDLAAELVGHEGDGPQMLVLVTKRLTDDQIRWVEVFPQRVLGSFLCHLVPLGL
jgi:hypothetical protein